MRRFLKIVAMTALAWCATSATEERAHAGRIGGPASQTVMLGAGSAVNIDVPFVAGEQAVVRLVGDGRSIVVLNLYDADGHVATGVGRVDQRVVSMDVYRTGVLRVEVINLGVVPNNVLLLTN